MKILESPSAGTSPGERACAYGILRYTPNLVRDEWLNIGVLTFDPKTGERRLRLIEEQDEYNRIRRLHPQADEMLLRALGDDLEDRFQRAPFCVASCRVLDKVSSHLPRSCCQSPAV